MVDTAKAALHRASSSGWKLLGLVFLAVLYLNASKLEGAVFPVTTDFKITAAKLRGEPATGFERSEQRTE